MLQVPLHQMLCVLGSAFALGGCGPEFAPQESAIEWHRVPWTQGTLNVALVRPADEGSGPHPVIFALPWGSGDAQLVESFIQSYWLTEPAARGYYVVAPEVRGSSLVDTAGDVIPAIFQWMQETLSFDADRVALVGASNGGRGIFFAALSMSASGFASTTVIARQRRSSARAQAASSMRELLTALVTNTASRATGIRLRHFCSTHTSRASQSG